MNATDFDLFAFVMAESWSLFNYEFVIYGIRMSFAQVFLGSFIFILISAVALKVFILDD